MSKTQTLSLKGSILIVDDNPANLNLLSEILSDAGYKVRAALNSQLAIKSAELSLPDLILLDILMPEMDGYQVCEKLKAFPATQDIPIIFISALSEVVDKVKAFALGGVDYITKPFQAEEVLARVENQLRIQRLSKQLLEQNTRLEEELRERQRAEEALRASESQLQLALEGSEEGWWDWNIATGEMNLSNRWWQMLGYEVGELSEHLSTWEQMIHPNDKPWVMELLDAHLKDSSVPYHFDYRFLSKSGEWKWIACYGKVVIRDELGKPLRMSGTHRDITARKQAESIIEASLKEKEVLLKEIHHRVKNNLQIVSSLLQMQARRTQDIQASLVLQDSQNRIKSIALVHEKLYRSEDLANINFAQYIPDLTSHLFSAYQVNSDTVTLHTNIDGIFLDIDQAIPCGLIINELVSNSLKYAFPKNAPGEIWVEFHVNSDDTLTLIVRDNGIGISKELDIETTTSLGLTLVQGLTEQLEGTLELDGSQGTEFKITFPRDGGDNGVQPRGI